MCEDNTYQRPDGLEVDIVLILCKFERIFPLAFFDVMIHLAVYLQAKTKIVGPVSYNWMYPIKKLAYIKTICTEQSSS